MQETFTGITLDLYQNRPPGFEMSGWQDNDLMFIRGIAVREGINANNAMFDRAELEKASHSFIGKPLKIRFIGGSPTGHGYIPETDSFDELVKAIGTISGASTVQDDDGMCQVQFEGFVWKKYYPEIANRLKHLHETGGLKFSFEASRDQELTSEGYRRCFNITFHGLCVVANPAEPEARSLMVAEILQGESKMENQNTQEQSVTVDGIIDLKIENAELKGEIATLQGELASIKTEMETYKQVAELAETIKVGGERKEKLTKYGAIDKTDEELGKMSREDFLTMLENMVTDYKPPVENAEKNDVVMGVPHDTVHKPATDRKKSLLDICQGIGMISK